MYLSGASALLAGEALTARQPSYAGYIAIVALADALDLGLPGVVALQVMAATAAAAIVFVLAATLGGILTAVLAVSLLAVDVETNRWHTYILSDSLFASALVAATWLGYRASVSRTTASYLLAIVVTVAAAIVRPEGWFLLPAVVAFWIARAPITRGRRAVIFGALAIGCGVLAAIVAPRLSGNVSAVGPAEMLTRGQTIWEYDGWRVNMPADEPRDGSAGDAVAYALRHPISTAALMAARVAVHFAHVRPFFSTPHNLIIVAWLVPIYALAVYGAVAGRRHVLTWWCAVVLGTQTLVVALTHADWDGRYLAHVMPLIYPFTAFGATELALRWRRGAVERAAIA